MVHVKRSIFQEIETMRVSGRFGWCVVRALLVLAAAVWLVSPAFAADEYVMYNTYCVRFEYINGAESIAEEVGWTESCPAGWYLSAPADQYMALLSAYRAALSAANGGSSTGSSFTAEEVTALKYQAANPSPFNLSIQDGSTIAGAIAAIWGLAWAIRALVRSLNTDGEKE